METADLTKAEREFFSENNLFTIIPNFQEEKVHLISGDFGPFRPNKPVEVPLWLAMYLKKKGKCRIVPPPWMELNYLRDRLNLELAEKTALSALPPHFKDVFNIISTYASEDVPNIAGIQSVLEHILKLRADKLKQLVNSSLDDLSKGKTKFIRIPNLNECEVDERKKAMELAANMIDTLHTKGMLAQDDIANPFSQTQNSTQH
eukprot:TRINITY_DN20145_c0_g1_i1.p1 TRINITY_DN20145_c0_g1~~TRINITY_DN20145_c0_g1_i1.p1  ORF type:complete len:204 (-),score=53.20 TRINITY_DN20145_c0_g1_i1:85-696(-)